MQGVYMPAVLTSLLLRNAALDTSSLLMLCPGNSWTLLPLNRLGVGDITRAARWWAEGSLCLWINQASHKDTLDSMWQPNISDPLPGKYTSKIYQYGIGSCCQSPEEIRPSFNPTHGIDGPQSVLDFWVGFPGILLSPSDAPASFHHFNDPSISLHETWSM